VRAQRDERTLFRRNPRRRRTINIYTVKKSARKPNFVSPVETYVSDRLARYLQLQSANNKPYSPLSNVFDYFTTQSSESQVIVFPCSQHDPTALPMSVRPVISRFRSRSARSFPPSEPPFVSRPIDGSRFLHTFLPSSRENRSVLDAISLGNYSSTRVRFHKYI